MDFEDVGRLRRVMESGDTRGMREGVLAALAGVVGFSVFMVTESWIWTVAVTVPFLAVVLITTRPKPVIALSLTEHQREADENEAAARVVRHDSVRD